MRPENVNPSNFIVDSILFDNTDFAVAYGTWEDGSKVVAMRWNGADTDPGYPKVFGHPMWFIVTEELRLPIIRSLVGLENTNRDNLLKTLQDLP